MIKKKPFVDFMGQFHYYNSIFAAGLIGGNEYVEHLEYLARKAAPAFKCKNSTAIMLVNTINHIRHLHATRSEYVLRVNIKLLAARFVKDKSYFYQLYDELKSHSIIKDFPLLSDESELWN